MADSHPMREQTRKLTVVSPGGLGNRLKVLLSGRALADATDRAFAMKWPGGQLGCSFERLFQNDWNVADGVTVDWGRLIDLTIGRWREFPDLLSAKAPDLYVRYYNWLAFPELYPSHRSLQDRAIQLIGELSPTPAIAKRVEQFRASSFRPHMIGVHLRRGDLAKARPDVVNNLPPALEATDRFLDRFSDAGILLCTDDGAPTPYLKHQTPVEGIFQKFVARYGDRVVKTHPRTLDRSVPEATEDALVDLWLLRQVDSFVGTVASSFSELAAFGRAIPAAMTAGPTPALQDQARWLKAVRADSLVKRLSVDEFGHEAPLGLVWWHKRVRAEAWMSKALRQPTRSRRELAAPSHTPAPPPDGRRESSDHDASQPDQT